MISRIDLSHEIEALYGEKLGWFEAVQYGKLEMFLQVLDCLPNPGPIA